MAAEPRERLSSDPILPPFPLPGSFHAGLQPFGRFRSSPASFPPTLHRLGDQGALAFTRPGLDPSSEPFFSFSTLVNLVRLASGHPNPAAFPRPGPPCLLFPATLRFKFSLGCEPKLLSGFVAAFNMGTYIFTFPPSVPIEKY